MHPAFSILLAGICLSAPLQAQVTTATGDHRVTLALKNIELKEAKVPWQYLFNNLNLTGWDTYLGPQFPAQGEDRTGIPAIGLNKDPKRTFSVVTKDGKKALRISGEQFGGISTTAVYENYHLQLQFKWGKQKYHPKTKDKMDSGLLYHANGPHGADWGFWMQSQEFQIQEGDCGDYWGVASAVFDIPAKKQGTADWIYHPDGERMTFKDQTPAGRHCIRKMDAEKPLGQWNTIDLYCFGDTAVHVVNGEVAMVLYQSRRAVDNGFEPLTKGKIQLQSEGAEIFYRDIRIRPIQQILPARPADSSFVVALWPNGAPGFENRKDEPEQAKDWWVRNVHNPSITAYLPPKGMATGAAVVICPGGGHRNLVFNSEGKQAAAYFNSIGVAAFVLKYRLFREENSPYTDEHARQDGFRAMRLVRSRAADWHLDPKRIGIMGFSAGGELAAWVSFGKGEAQRAAADPVERYSARPDFQVLIYPGPLAVPESVQPTAPPAFLLAANDDECCSEPVLALAQQYRKAKIPVEAHLYAQGNHAFNMGNRSTLGSIHNWSQRLTDWLKDNKWLVP